MPVNQDPRIKLFLIHRGLRARRENRDLFEKGDYLPASATGSRAQHVVAFFRQLGEQLCPDGGAAISYLIDQAR